MTVFVNAPAVLNGASLAAELTTAGVSVGLFDVMLVDEQVSVNTPVANAAVVQQVVQAHTGQPLAAETARVARGTDADSALAQLIQLAGGTAAARSKLKAVLAGTDTLTNAQAQRLLAAVALCVLRDRTDS